MCSVNDVFYITHNTDSWMLLHYTVLNCSLWNEDCTAGIKWLRANSYSTERHAMSPPVYSVMYSISKAPVLTSNVTTPCREP